jgi:hypothetical protein
MRAFLGKIGGRQIDRDPLRRQRQAERVQRRPDAFARFRDGLVGEADDGEVRQARGGRLLHVDGKHLDPLKSDALHPPDHRGPRNHGAKCIRVPARPLLGMWVGA